MESEQTHYAMIVGSFPPRATVIAHGPMEFCLTSLIDWVSNHGIDEDETAQLLKKEGPIMEQVEQNPGVGLPVHYVSYGTPGGEYTSKCRAAIITELPEVLRKYGYKESVQLCVLNPKGIFFDTCEYSHGGTTETRKGGTWHHIGECGN